MFSNELVCDLLAYISANINREIVADELHHRFYFDKSYIMKRFKKEMGISIHRYINQMRIYNSLPFLKEDYTVLKIALYNGFQSLEYYSEIFKKRWGSVLLYIVTF